METEIVFKNAGEPWSKEEDTQLNNSYNEDMIDIIEISKIHNIINYAPQPFLQISYILHRQRAKLHWQ